MPLVTTTEMFKKAYSGGYAIGAFNVNNMEIVQGITEAAREEKKPAARKGAKAEKAPAKKAAKAEKAPAAKPKKAARTKT